jgi:biopolymer transport protein ExbD
MKNLKMPRVRDMHPNVTPLIDVVMCLIIFYMLGAKIGVATGADKTIQLPFSDQGIKITDFGNTVTLNVTKGGDDQPTVTTLDPHTGQVIPLRILDGPRRPLASFLKLLKGQNADIKVIIRGDQDLDYRYLEPVLITCTEALVKNVNFAARVSQPGSSATGG